MRGIRYTILYKKSVEKELQKIALPERVVVVQKILALAKNPYPSSAAKLQGSLGLYRIRSGDYRIIYQVDQGRVTVVIIKIGHRKEVYRKPPKPLP